MSNQEQEVNLINWIGKVEKDVSETQQRLSSVEAKVDTVLSSNNSLHNQLLSIQSALSDKNKTNWGPIFSGLALVLAIGGGYTTMVSVPIKENQRAGYNYLNEKIELKTRHQNEVSLLYKEIEENLVAGLQKEVDELKDGIKNRTNDRFTRRDANERDAYYKSRLDKLNENILDRIDRN